MECDVCRWNAIMPVVWIHILSFADAYEGALPDKEATEQTIVTYRKSPPHISTSYPRPLPSRAYPLRCGFTSGSESCIHSDEEIFRRRQWSFLTMYDVCSNTMPLCTHVRAVRTIRQRRRVIVQDKTNVLPIFYSNRLVHRNSLHSLHSAHLPAPH